MGEGGGRAGKTPRGGLSSPPLGKCAGIGLRLVRLARRVPRSGRPGGEKAVTRRLQAGLPPPGIRPRRPIRGTLRRIVVVPRIAGAEPVWAAGYRAGACRCRKLPAHSVSYSAPHFRQSYQNEGFYHGRSGSEGRRAGRSCRGAG